MPLLIPDNFPGLLVYDTSYRGAPVSIYFNTQKQITEIIYNGTRVSEGPVADFVRAEMQSRIFPLLQQPSSSTPPISANPTNNPAERLRQEVAAEKARMPQSAPNAPPPSLSQPQPQPQQPVATSVEAIASLPSDTVLHTHSVCDRCPVACKVDITHSPTGKFIGVTGNACGRGVGYAQNFLLEKYSEPLGF